MAAIPYDTASAFMAKLPARNGAFRSMGDAIYSYDMKLAHWEGDQVVLDTDLAERVSATTSRHMRALRVALEEHPERTHRIESKAAIDALART